MTTTLDQIVAAIAAGELDAQLTTIHHAINTRVAILFPPAPPAFDTRGHTEEIPCAPAPAKVFRVGSKVRLNSGCRPLYMVGKTGTVTKVNAASVLVQLDHGGAEGRFSGTRPIKCPKSIVDLA